MAMSTITSPRSTSSDMIRVATVGGRPPGGAYTVASGFAAIDIETKLLSEWRTDSTSVNHARQPARGQPCIRERCVPCRERSPCASAASRCRDGFQKAEQEEHEGNEEPEANRTHLDELGAGDGFQKTGKGR